MAYNETATVTNLSAGTLSNEDRELFLKGQGLAPETPEAEAAAIRAQWADDDILMAIGAGLF